ncbi:UNVERIFIED_CONTAM: hypothetical protein Slati_2733100 [Sesamum latifolium]|uniref:Uncharacterized protein n=1 Tax=Sesamum latifolium TaxID=2727402 RepID=A0AAW2VY44_9LAMI
MWYSVRTHRWPSQRSWGNSWGSGANQHAKYLGLPAVVRRSKREIFDGLKVRIWRKMQSWLARLLSQARWAVLIKSVLQVIPSYAMNCFKMPDGLLSDIESMMANFF